jgi:hypothetical protein
LEVVRVDIHDYEARLRRSLAGAWRAMHSKDVESVQALVDWCLAYRISMGRCAFYAQNFKRLLVLLGVGFKEASQGGRGEGSHRVEQVGGLNLFPGVKLNIQSLNHGRAHDKMPSGDY